MKKKGGGGCGCLSALSRACDSVCDLYVRGMSGCARHVPSGSSVGVVGRGFAGAPSLRLRVSSDKADDDLVRAAPARRRQRRVAAEPEAVGETGSADVTAARTAARRKPVAAAMGTIDEDAPCEFGPDGACAVRFTSVKLPPPPPRRGGSGAVKAAVFAR